MNDFVRVITAFVVVLLAGLLVIRAADKRGEIDCGVGARFSLAFMLGLGAISLQMFFYAIASIEFGYVRIAAPWVVLSAVSLAFPGRKKASQKPPPGGFGAVEAVFEIIILSQAAYLLLYAFLLPVFGWDAWHIWLLKAKVFFVEKGVPTGFLLDEALKYAHQDYPLLVPLSTAWIYTALGAAEETAAKVMWPIQFLAMINIFHFAAKKAAGARVALVFAALLALTPIMLSHASGLLARVGPLPAGNYAGYADLTLSIYLMSAGAFLYIYASEGGGWAVTFSAASFALAAWTKNEGLPAALFGLILISWCAFGRKGWIIKTAGSAAIVLLFTAPWFLYKSYYGIGSEYTGNLSPALIAENIGRLKIIIPSLLSYLFTETSLYNFAWWVYAVSLALNWRGFMKRPVLVLNLMVFFQTALYVFVYVITPADVKWQLSTSLDRVVLHILPLAMLVSAVNVSSFIRAGVEPQSED
ncbi:MAG: hypothetical protein A2X99_05065 [Deltaproteobacteria bacterium GWB2_55_19]|nr:MAG: hypothetical protein A2X99_05065 [Deltaproteobacteria bacterium GWB2_55_19]HAO93266.1 hypothetical protein [Deltaproteobacteria bacterium]